MHRIEHNHAFGYLGGVLMKFAPFGIATPDFENGCFHMWSMDVSGERMPLACWRTSPGVRELMLEQAGSYANKTSEKVRCGGTLQPGRRSRALPDPVVPHVTLISFLQSLASNNRAFPAEVPIGLAYCRPHPCESRCLPSRSALPSRDSHRGIVRPGFLFAPSLPV